MHNNIIIQTLCKQNLFEYKIDICSQLTYLYLVFARRPTYNHCICLYHRFSISASATLYFE